MTPYCYRYGCYFIRVDNLREMCRRCRELREQ